MNIQVNNQTNSKKKLFESQEVNISPQQMMQDASKGKITNIENIQEVFDVSANQFKFDCGVFMANIKVNIDNPFGLRYFADKAQNLDEFILLISKNINITGNDLTENDIENLTREYHRIYPEK